jgi:hypothetical protein
MHIDVSCDLALQRHSQSCQSKKNDHGPQLTGSRAHNRALLELFKEEAWPQRKLSV